MRFSSVFCSSPRSSRDHERQPRIGQLQLGGVNRGFHGVRCGRGREAPPLQSAGKLLQGAARGNLRLGDANLVGDRYVLAEDVEGIMSRAGERYDAAVGEEEAIAP